jgi:hypothetical protein
MTSRSLESAKQVELTSVLLASILRAKLSSGLEVREVEQVLKHRSRFLSMAKRVVAAVEERFPRPVADDMSRIVTELAAATVASFVVKSSLDINAAIRRVESSIDAPINAARTLLAKNPFVSSSPNNYEAFPLEVREDLILNAAILPALVQGVRARDRIRGTESIDVKSDCFSSDRERDTFKKFSASIMRVAREDYPNERGGAFLFAAAQLTGAMLSGLIAGGARTDDAFLITTRNLGKLFESAKLLVREADCSMALPPTDPGNSIMAAHTEIQRQRNSAPQTTVESATERGRNFIAQ